MEILHSLKLGINTNCSSEFNFKNKENINLSFSNIYLPNGKKISDVEIFINSQKKFSFEPTIVRLRETKNNLSKDDSYFCFGDSINGKKLPNNFELVIKTNTESKEVLGDYLGVNYNFGLDRIIIRINRIKNNEDRTVGILNIDGDAISGYTLELPKGNENECKSECTPELKIDNKCNRIYKGTYKFRVTEVSSKSWAINKSLRLLDIPGRTGILMHRGVNARIWSEGCILAMKNDPSNDEDDTSAEDRANKVTDSEDFCVEVVNYINQREEEIKEYYKIEEVEKIIIITENNEIQD